MNCKPGDLAIVVRSMCGNEGRVLKCIRLLSFAECVQEQHISDFVWETDTPILDSCGDRMCRCEDSILRPIRDGEGNESWFKAAPLPKVLEAV